MEKIFISQSEIDELILKLCQKIENSNKTFDQVIGIANGGLNISKKVANYLNLPHKSILISCWYDDCLHTNPIIKGLDFVFENNKIIPNIENSLIVDDLTDSGTTFDTLKNFAGENNSYAVLLWQPNSFDVDFYVKEKPNNWIVFPWEL